MGEKRIDDVDEIRYGMMRGGNDENLNEEIRWRKIRNWEERIKE